MTTHQSYMQHALELARKGHGFVAPNPMVGCVIVKGGQIIGSGYHRAYGEAHAEVNALQMAGNAANGATLYVTLEPCCHHGKTPPCTDAIIRAGIKHVYVACLDPNPLVSGKGIALLQAAGITVDVGLEEAAAKQLNEIFFYYMAHKRPFVIAKWAMSLDGKTVTHAHDERKISNAASHEHVHQTRKIVDAILVGAHTVRCDNPLLTARCDDVGKQPLRVILTTCGEISIDSNVFNSNTLVVTTESVDLEWKNKLQDKKIEVVILGKDKVDLSMMLDELAKRGISSLLIEGGMNTLQQFFSEGLVNQVQVYLAPVIIGSHKKKMPVFDVVHTNISHDFHIIGKIKIGE